MRFLRSYPYLYGRVSHKFLSYIPYDCVKKLVTSAQALYILLEFHNGVKEKLALNSRLISFISGQESMLVIARWRWNFLILMVGADIPFFNVSGFTRWHLSRNTILEVAEPRPQFLHPKVNLNNDDRLILGPFGKNRSLLIKHG